MGIVIAPALANRGAAISRSRRMCDDLAGGELASSELSRRLLTGTALSAADSLAILHFAATRLPALAVGLPDAVLIAELGDVSSGVALPLSGVALDFLVAVGVARGTNVTGADLGASLNSLPTLGAAHHDRDVRVVALVGTEVAV
jgi:hypothetical protein